MRLASRLVEEQGVGPPPSAASAVARVAEKIHKLGYDSNLLKRVGDELQIHVRQTLYSEHIIAVVGFEYSGWQSK